MKFGPVEVRAAQGAVLAHSVGLGASGRLRKGRILTADDIEKLEHTGLAEVTVARLDADDVHEDAAAQALANAFVPEPNAQGLRLTEPFTGRVNLIAEGPGVVTLDASAIAAVNAVDPMITIATVPDNQQMRDGGMVATIKIISYGVNTAALKQACAKAKACIELMPPKLMAPRLIVSDIPGGVGDKGWRATADRVAAFGLDLPPPVIVPRGRRGPIGRCWSNTPAGSGVLPGGVRGRWPGSWRPTGSLRRGAGWSGWWLSSTAGWRWSCNVIGCEARSTATNSWSSCRDGCVSPWWPPTGCATPGPRTSSSTTSSPVSASTPISTRQAGCSPPTASAISRTRARCSVCLPIVSTQP